MLFRSHGLVAIIVPLHEMLQLVHQRAEIKIFADLQILHIEIDDLLFVGNSADTLRIFVAAVKKAQFLVARKAFKMQHAEMGIVINAGSPFDLPVLKAYFSGADNPFPPAAELDATVGALTDRLAANAPLSLKAIKALLLKEMTFRDGIEHSDVDELVQAVRASEDAVEGRKARLEKRAANFQGR